ncbi:hypothetical protein EJ04DRAFT_549442 [Polyplosphaeria fusca]|uniref:Uncharacterized protein n=1 Tax=Polyplosphaeria fusca TaxID=682080 RepID=A0A9P4V6V8_9PLEO|nr:hypothetical protein EJ04DRAFT_549442 [Polyplosphaeria fusca]
MSTSSPSTTSTSATTSTQRKPVLPLTTTFTPPVSCAENHLTRLPAPGNQIWVNEPVPAGNATQTACYPSEFLNFYRAVTSSGSLSSAVPAMSPLVCPQKFCTALAGEGNYVACCPEGFKMEQPKVVVDAKRPGYGGTCVSELEMGSTYDITAWNSGGEQHRAVWVASKSSAQAFAHPIDGFAAENPTLGCAPKAQEGAHISTPAIIAIAVGGASLLAVMILLVWFIFRCRRRRRMEQLSPEPPLKIRHIEHDRVRERDRIKAQQRHDSFGYGGDNLRYGGDNLRYGGDNLRYGEDNLRYGGDNLRYGGDSLRYGEDRFGYGGRF